MRRAAKTDANQADVVAALRAAGASVLHLHQVGHGCPDIAVGHNNKTYLMEIKSGRGMLTPDELTFFETWRGQVVAVYSAEDALRVIGAV